MSASVSSLRIEGTAAFRLILWASAVFIAVVTFALGWVSGNLFTLHVLEHEGRHTAQIVRAATAATILQTGTGGMDPNAAVQFVQRLPGVFRVTVFDAAGRIAWSDEPALVGRSFPDNDSLRRSLGGEIVTKLRKPASPENRFEREKSQVIEVYVPVHSSDGREVAAVVETYKDGAPVQADVRRMRLAVGGLAGGATLLLWLALAWVVGRASRAYRHAQELEQLTLERKLGLTERLRAAGEIAAGITHDLPLAEPIRASLENLERAASDGIETLRRLRELVRRREARPFERVDPNQLVADAVAMTEPRWKGRPGIEVHQLLDEIQPVMGRPSELREVLVNLILNALDAMPEGGTLALSTHCVGNRVCVEVADTGVGMPEEIQRRIFDPFFTTKAEGSGLGLSVAYGIVKQHGGEIRVESEEGKASRFTVALPVAGVATDEGPRQ